MTTTQNTQFEVGTIVHVAPGTLLLERNIREAQPDKALTQSVRAIGVQVPITAVITTDGALLVRQGHRRTLAAIESERETVPVYVTDVDSTETTDEILRVIAQRDENTHRAGLTASDEVGIVETLTGLGLSAAQVAKQARIKRADVDAALTVAGSELARKAAHRYADLTLEQFAVVAEFEADPETVKALIVAAHEGRFDHAAQRARNDRAEAAQKAEVLAMLEADGVRVISYPGSESKTKGISDFKASTEAEEPLTAAEHAECPGHVAWLGVEWVRVDANGALVEVPDEPEDHADDEAWEAYEAEVEKIRAASRQVQHPAAIYGCENPGKYGHIDRYGRTPDTGKPTAAEMSDDEREAAKKARALVIENNKAWDAAQTVRRDWLREFAARKTPPKGTAAFLATALCRDSHAVSAVGGNSLAAEWLGNKHTGYGRADLSPTKTTTENRALVLTLVQVLGGYESQMTKDSWRHNGTNSSVGRYLRFIETSGYALADVEKFAISEKTA